MPICRHIKPCPFVGYSTSLSSDWPCRNITPKTKHWWNWSSFFPHQCCWMSKAFFETQRFQIHIECFQFAFTCLIKMLFFQFSSVQFSSVTQSCPTLSDPMNCSTPGLPVHHQLPEFTQTHIHRVVDAIQPSHPLSSPFSSCPWSLPASGF